MTRRGPTRGSDAGGAASSDPSKPIHRRRSIRRGRQRTVVSATSHQQIVGGGGVSRRTRACPLSAAARHPLPPTGGALLEVARGARSRPSLCENADCGSALANSTCQIDPGSHISGAGGFDDPGNCASAEFSHSLDPKRSLGRRRSCRSRPLGTLLQARSTPPRTQSHGIERTAIHAALSSLRRRLCASGG